MKKTDALSFTQAIDMYYGGVHNINRMPLPFTCKCGGKTYTEHPKNDVPVTFPVMTIEDCFAHIRKDHKERIKRGKV